MENKKIIVVGGGVTGLAIACLLKRQLPRELVDIKLIDDTRGDKVFSETTHSAIHNFHDLIGLDEKVCMLDRDTTFNLGLLYKNWSFPSQEFILSEGTYGAPLGGADFKDIFAKCKNLDGSYCFDDYSINAAAAKYNRFGHPSSDLKSIYSSIKYGLNFYTDSYAKTLKKNAINLGVEIYNANCISVDVSKINGNIDSIKLSNDDILSADLFVDCSGDASVLLGDALGVDDIEDELSQLFGKSVSGYCGSVSRVKSAATVEQGRYGYLKRIPLKHGETVSYVFDDGLVSSDVIENDMLAYGVNEVKFFTESVKRKRSFWVKNCVAIGDSALSFNDLYLSPQYIARNSIVRFLDLLVDFDSYEQSRYEYNRLSVMEYDHIKEILELHFYLAKDNSHIINEYFLNKNLSDSAHHRLELFNVMGRYAQSDAELMSESSWIAFFMGNGVVPKNHNFFADKIDIKKIISHTEKLKNFIHKSVENIPKQEDYVAQIAASKN